MTQVALGESGSLSPKLTLLYPNETYNRYAEISEQSNTLSYTIQCLLPQYSMHVGATVTAAAK